MAKSLNNIRLKEENYKYPKTSIKVHQCLLAMVNKENPYIQRQQTPEYQC